MYGKLEADEEEKARLAIPLVCFICVSCSMFSHFKYRNMLIRPFIIHVGASNTECEMCTKPSEMLHIKLKLLFDRVVRKAHKNQTSFTFAQELDVGRETKPKQKIWKNKMQRKEKIVDVNVRRFELIMVSISNQWRISIRWTLLESQIQHIRRRKKWMKWQGGMAWSMKNKEEKQWDNRMR